jgi:hypothetical protein
VLIGWCSFSAVLLIVCVVVHASTFLGIDPIAKWPGVMFLHVAIFPPFFAAVYYSKGFGIKDQMHQQRAGKSAPRWLRILTGAFFVYAFLNFAVFAILSEGGMPAKRDGKYVVTSRGKVLRELSEAEFHRRQAYVVRGFSGHWMLFGCASLMFLVGEARLRRDVEAEPALSSRSSSEDVPENGKSERSKKHTTDPPVPTSAIAGIFSFAVYVASVAMILSGQPALGAAAALPVLTACVLAMRRRRGFPHSHFESRIGCLVVFPNALIASQLGRRAVEFLYVAIYAGLHAALNHEVSVTFPKGGPAQLSNGLPLDNRVWSGMGFFVLFPLFAFGTIGLTYLAEQVGRWIEVRTGDTRKSPVKNNDDEW